VNASSSTIRGLLRPNERLLWEGKPDVWAYSMRGALYLIPFSLLWGGFAIFWEVSVLTSKAPWFFAIWGVPFVAIGLYMIFGRILYARREAANTTYAVTDERVLIQSGVFRPRLTVLDLSDLPPLQLDDGGRGLGTVTIGASMSPIRIPSGWPAMGMYARPPSFASIPDATKVFELLQDAKTEARRRDMRRS
jgi:Bacterial PH domain